MRILLMCEGPDEKAVIDILLDNECLRFGRDDLIGQTPFHIRQLKPPVTTDIKHYGQPIMIYRIGDKQTDKLKIPKELKDLISNENIKKYCTKPELEVLMIITEGMYHKFQRSKLSPSKFAKINISCNGKKYNKSVEFINDYYAVKGVNALVESIREYKRIKKKTHLADEDCLADLLKE